MAENSQSDFYGNIESLTLANEDFRVIIDDLIDQWEKLNSAVQTIYDNNYVQGEWFDSFLAAYEERKEEFHLVIAQSVALSYCLEMAVDTIPPLVEQRNNLSQKLL